MVRLAQSLLQPVRHKRRGSEGALAPQARSHRCERQRRVQQRVPAGRRQDLPNEEARSIISHYRLTSQIILPNKAELEAQAREKFGDLDANTKSRLEEGVGRR